MSNFVQRKLVMAWTRIFLVFLEDTFVVLPVLDSALRIFSDQDEVQAFSQISQLKLKNCFLIQRRPYCFSCADHLLDFSFIIKLFRLFWGRVSEASENCWSIIHRVELDKWALYLKYTFCRSYQDSGQEKVRNGWTERTSRKSREKKSSCVITL